MRQITGPHKQAQHLREYLATQGLVLEHQPSLEAVARVMGYKNWMMMMHIPARPAAVESTNSATYDLLALTDDDFEPDTAVVANNMGMGGEFQVMSKDGQYLLEARLDSLNPDNSDDELRAQCSLGVCLKYAQGHELEGTIIQVHEQSYVYDGDDRGRGDHLEGLFQDDELIAFLDKNRMCLSARTCLS